MKIDQHSKPPKSSIIFIIKLKKLHLQVSGSCRISRHLMTSQGGLSLKADRKSLVQTAVQTKTRYIFLIVNNKYILIIFIYDCMCTRGGFHIF